MEQIVKMKSLLLTVILFAGLIVSGCGSGGCLENGSTLPLAGFYSAQTLEAISVDSLMVRGVDAPGDSVLLSPQRGVSSVYLPFKADADSVKWVFSVDTRALNHPELYDTITFVYRTLPYFASSDCGAMYIYRVSRVGTTTHLIDSVAVTDSLFTNVDREQIKIYFRTESE